MTWRIDGLVISRVVGDVVDWFVQTIIMTICFGGYYVTNGCHVKPSMALHAPTITITGLTHEFYTLVMTDPDAPSPSDPSMREHVHWIVTDIPGGTDVAQGQEVVQYMAPEPSRGIHRYTFVLFKQKQPLGNIEPPMSRFHFNTRAFAQRLDLGPTVACVYFNASKEPLNKRRRY